MNATQRDVADLEKNLMASHEEQKDRMDLWKHLPESPTLRVTMSDPIQEKQREDSSSLPEMIRSSSAPTDTRPSKNQEHKDFSQIVFDMSKSFRMSLKRHSSVPLFNCQICLENHALSEAFSVPGCVANHQFCAESLGMLLSTQINDGVLEVRCPCFGFDSCNAVFSTQDIEQLVDIECYTKYLRFLNMQRNPRVRECPKCLQQSSEGSESRPEITCSGCSEVYCFLHSNAHPTMTCAEYTKVLAKTEMQSLRQIKASTRKCPQCKVDTEKSGGCNHMSCQACKADWCWLCESLIGPNHYDYNNFLAGCAGQQFSEESMCCRFTACRLLCGRTCGKWLKTLLIGLLGIPFALVCIAVILAFLPLSGLIALLYMGAEMMGGFESNREDMLSSVEWIIMGTPLFFPFALIFAALQIIYFPLAFVFFILYSIVSLCSGRDKNNVPDYCFETYFWFAPIGLFVFVVIAITSEDDD